MEVFIKWVNSEMVEIFIRFSLFIHKHYMSVLIFWCFYIFQWSFIIFLIKVLGMSGFIPMYNLKYLLLLIEGSFSLVLIKYRIIIYFCQLILFLVTLLNAIICHDYLSWFSWIFMWTIKLFTSNASLDYCFSVAYLLFLFVFLLHLLEF